MADRVVVVGGGHIGIACAYYLQQDGLDVTVIDQGKIGGACSYANCGFIVPSHILPLATPDALWNGARSLFNPRAAFRVKPQLRLGLMRWMWEFSRRCTQKRMLQAGAVLQQLLGASANEFQNLLSNPEIDCEWHQNGMLFVFRCAAALEEYSQTDRLMTQEFGVSARAMLGDELAEFEPALQDDLAGAYFYEGDSHLRADRLNDAWIALLKKRGVTFCEDCQVKSIEKNQGKLTRLHTSTGILEADQFVFATGAWSSHLAKDLDCRIPVEPGKGYSVTMPKPDPMPSHPMLMPEQHIGITPFDNSYRIASMMEFVGFDSTIPDFRIQQLQDSAKPFLKSPVGPAIQETWYGWRPMTWDSLPIIGRVPRLANALLATGHNMLGLSLAPVTGRAIADIVAERPSDLPLDAVSVARFS